MSFYPLLILVFAVAGVFAGLYLKFSILCFLTILCIGLIANPDEGIELFLFFPIFFFLFSMVAGFILNRDWNQIWLIIAPHVLK